MKNLVIIDRTKEKPLRTILLVLTILAMLAALFYVTPWYGPPEVSSITFFRVGTFERAVINAVITCSIGIYTLRGIKKRDNKAMARGAFLFSMSYLFSAVGRIITVVYPLQLLWMSPLMIAFVFAVIYVYYKGWYRYDQAVSADDRTTN